MASAPPPPTPSPGEAYSSPGVPPMNMPHLDFVYRIVCEMDPQTTTIAGVQAAAVDRLVLPIARGVVRGPRIRGTIVPNSGADWAQLVHGEKVAIRLDARYTLQTDDGHFVLVTAKGMYRQGPGPVDPDAATWPTVGQDRVEYFTHLSFEAPGTSPYGWMNHIVALGVMTMWEDRPIIDCYRLTNFPAAEAEN